MTETAHSEFLPNLGVLVTGGAGFLGRAIVHELLEPSSPVNPHFVRILDIREPRDLHDDRITFMKGDVTNYTDVHEACKDIDLVIHTAAIVDWGTRSEREVYDVNFGGTQNVIKACRAHKVRMLVYTSTLDTVITGGPLVDVDETVEYPETHQNMYCESKCQAEKLVVSETDVELRTCILRPSDIYGEGDPYHIQPLIEMAKSGFYIRIGDGSARSQHVYVGNMAHAHVLAARALIEENARVCGNAYFITDAPATNFFTFFDEIVVASGYRIRPKNLWLPRWLAYVLAVVLESIAVLARPIKHYNPKLSRFAVSYLCTDFTFSSKKAERDFRFVPKYTDQEAFNRTVDYFRKNQSSTSSR